MNHKRDHIIIHDFEGTVSYGESGKQYKVKKVIWSIAGVGATLGFLLGLAF
jgi:hypothetical protein